MDPWRSYRMPGIGEALREYREPLPQPQGNEVLLRVTSCGVCHSDLHIWEGFFDLGGGRKLDFAPNLTLPHTLGHEIAGEVVAVGPEVRDLEAGQRRVVFPWIGCGHCATCAAGQEHLCAAPRTLGTRQRGGFSTHVVVPHERYLVDFGSLPETLACTYACSGLTAFSALKKAAPVSATAPLLIIGAGGVGLAAVRLASSVHGVAPVVADIDPAKREAAMAAGAAQVLDPRDPQALAQLMDGTGGVAAVVDFVGAPATVGFAVQAARRGGRIVVVGLFGGALELALPLLPLRALTLQGSFVGSLQEMRELVALALSGIAPQIPIQTRALREAQHALDDLKLGRVLGRVVLQPETEFIQETNA